MLANIQGGYNCLNHKRFLFILWFLNVMRKYWDGREFLFLLQWFVQVWILKIFVLKKIQLKCHKSEKIKKFSKQRTQNKSRKLGSSPALITSCIIQGKPLNPPGSVFAFVTSYKILGVEEDDFTNPGKWRQSER